MDTKDGSFAFTDGGLNVSTSIADKFRVGAQGYSRNIGQLGGGRITLDWAFGEIFSTTNANSGQALQDDALMREANDTVGECHGYHERSDDFDGRHLAFQQRSGRRSEKSGFQTKKTEAPSRRSICFWPPNFNSTASLCWCWKAITAFHDETLCINAVEIVLHYSIHSGVQIH